MSIKEGVAKETLIGLASIRYGCSNLLYRGATLTFFSICIMYMYPWVVLGEIERKKVKFFFNHLNDSLGIP